MNTSKLVQKNKTNLILVNYNKQYSDLIIDYLKRQKINHLTLIDVKKPKQNLNFSLDFFNAEELAYGEYKNHKFNIDRLVYSDILKYLELESIVLDMLMRGEKPGKIYNNNKTKIEKNIFDFSNIDINLRYEERRSIYKKHLSLWLTLIKKRKINCFFSFSTPHIIYDFIPYYICKTKKIPTLFTEQNKYNGFRIPRFDLHSDMHDLIKVYKKLKKINKKTKLSTYGEAYINKMISNKMLPRYYNKKQHSYVGFPDIRLDPFVIFLLKILKNIFNKKMINFHIQRRIIQSRFVKKTKFLRSYYNSLCVQSLPESDFIFLPLHYQPESSTSPFGQMYSDQKYFIEEVLHLSSYLKYSLVVKEHPTQKATGRTLSFYEDFKNNKNLFFVKSDFDQYEIIKKCKFLVTITGTAGWEGIFLGKPVVSYGSSYLKHAPGVYNVNYNDDHEKIKKYLKNFKKPSINDIRLFFKAVELTSIKGFIIGDNEQIGMQMDENGFKKSANAFLDYFFEYLNV